MQSRKIVFLAIALLLFLTCEYQFLLNSLIFYCRFKANAWANTQVKAVPPAGMNSQQTIAFNDSVARLKAMAAKDYLREYESLGNPLLLPIPIGLLRPYAFYGYALEHTYVGKDRFKPTSNITLQISQADLLRRLANYSRDPQFNSAVDRAERLQPDSKQNFLALFKQQYDQIDSGSKLAVVFAPVDAFSGRITSSTSNRDVMELVQKDFDTDIAETFSVLKKRIARADVSVVDIFLKPATASVNIVLKGVDDTTSLYKLLQQPAELQFWNTFESEEVISNVVDANAKLKDLFSYRLAYVDSVLGMPGPKAVKHYNILADSMETEPEKGFADDPNAAGKNANPLFSFLYPNVQLTGQSTTIAPGPMIGNSFGKDTVMVNRLLAVPEVKALLPPNLKLMWGGLSFAKTNDVFGLYAIKLDPGSSEAPLGGDLVKNAYKVFDMYGIPGVDIALQNSAYNAWERMTAAAANGTVNGKRVHKSIAITVDDKVFSAPHVNEKIAGGLTQITGIESIKEADGLAALLTSGQLKATVKVKEAHFTNAAISNPRFAFWLAELVLSILIALTGVKLGALKMGLPKVNSQAQG